MALVPQFDFSFACITGPWLEGKLGSLGRLGRMDGLGRVGRLVSLSGLGGLDRLGRLGRLLSGFPNLISASLAS